MSLGDLLAEGAVKRTTEAVATTLLGAFVREIAALLGDDKLGLARALLGHALDAAPVEQLRAILDAEAQARVNAATDIAEDAKFGAP